MKNLPPLQRVAFTALVSLFFFAALAQVPQGLPDEPTETDFSNFANIIFYIIIPVLMLVFFLVMRKRSRQED